MSSHPSGITNTIAIIFTTSSIILAFADLVTILTEISLEKMDFFSFVQNFLKKKFQRFKFLETYPSGHGTVQEVPVHPGAHWHCPVI